jgi:exopolyphosphatase/guanosine-5'-triphosphate,3'-diphosphate pyrophosphatase
MKVAAIDIGSNSMRLLIVERIGDGEVELGRYERVTGLGIGVDATGVLTEEAIDRTLLALSEFGGRMEKIGVDRRRAVATSASRDASNRETFFDRAELALGVRPELIPGEREADLSFRGATTGMPFSGPFLVIDIGGGSTEFTTADGGRSFDIGSVRLTDRVLNARPAPPGQLAEARGLVGEMFLPISTFVGRVVGVAGTWTSLQRIENPETETHLAQLSAMQVSALVDRLAKLSVDETAALPGLDPARAPVILSGAVVAEAALAACGANAVTISEHDLLDGVVAELLG